MQNAIISYSNESAAIVRADSDETLVNLWLRNQASERTRVTYAKAIEQFMDFVGAPLQSLSMESVLEYK
ncbi:MAG: hypothetical protein KDE46_07225, partial [Caldilineaceae bacterium]|nr:hypothetical protein [Caldilineaceae bacterium]